MKILEDLKKIRNSSNPITEMLADQDLKNAYHKQYHNANHRGIEFNMSFEEWLLIWVASGKLHLRGKEAGSYVMCRFGDVGPYKVGNVYIDTQENNTRTRHLGHKKSVAHRRKLRKHLMTIRKLIPVTANGVSYSTLTEASKAEGISIPAVRLRCKSGSKHFKNWTAPGITKTKPKWEAKREAKERELTTNFNDPIDYEALAKGEL